jgi:3-hydroxy-9,10-secoandrosta-1,3,5(10)-triene-9,17-dione monooxygenase reductase component
MVRMTPDVLAAPDIDAARLRQVLRQVPTTVTVVAACTADGPFGLVVGSFVSISLNPPLIGIFIDERSTSWRRIRAAGVFAVNVLAHNQQDLCARFARTGGSEKFSGLSWRRSARGSPVLPGVSAWIDCRLQQTYKIGDHYLAVGRVLDLADAEPKEGHGIDPLIFHGGSLHTLSRGCSLSEGR